MFHDQSLFAALRKADQPIASSCLGVAVCARCLVRVQAPEGALSSIESVEARVLAGAGADSDQRLACQTFVLGPGVSLRTDYW